MIDPVSIYLKNLAKRAMNGERINPAEVVRLPQVIDSKFGNGDGVLDFEDVKNVAEDAIDAVTEITGGVLEFLGSLF